MSIYICRQCSLGIHPKTREKHICEVCYKDSQPREVPTNRRVVHNKEITSCTLCGKILGRERGSGHHIRVEHQGIQIMCKEGCGKGSNTPRNNTALLRHELAQFPLTWATTRITPSFILALRVFILIQSGLNTANHPGPHLAGVS